jgi:hypothetical protein
VTRITLRIAVAGSSVFNASRSLIYGSAGAAPYLLAGTSAEIGFAAVILSNADDNRHDEIQLPLFMVAVSALCP